ncbi:MAG: hypothetical protein OXF30_02275 [Candidatus Saccharibacteria bacterium]|nr:hypothetical protein [Candidatus Saccharibacteria bacterium]
MPKGSDVPDEQPPDPSSDGPGSMAGRPSSSSSPSSESGLMAGRPSSSPDTGSES